MSVPETAVPAAANDVAVGPAKRRQRLDFLDHIRVLLASLVIWHHLAIACGAAGSWYFRLPSDGGSVTPLLLTMFTAINQAFFMSLFFAVSAYVTPPSLDARGVQDFLRGRLLRLGIPLLAYFFVLNPTVHYLVTHFQTGYPQGYLHFMQHHASEEFGTGPLWFALALLMFSVPTCVWQLAVGRPRPAQQDRSFPSSTAIGLFVAVNALVAWLVRIWFPAGWSVYGLQPGYFPLYLSMYSAGIAAWRGNWLADLQPSLARRWFRIAVGWIVVLPVVLLLASGPNGDTSVFMGDGTWQSLLYAIWEPFLCVGISLQLLVVFRDRFGNGNALTRELARSSYTVYIIHPLIVVTATGLAATVPLGHGLLFLLLCPLCVVVCFAVAAPLRRLPGFSRIL